MRKLALLIGASAGLQALSPSFAQHHPAPSTAEAPWSQADAYYDPEEMAEARAQVLHHHGNATQSFVMADRLEWQSVDDDDQLVWDLNAWRGGDINKIALKSEGEYELDGGSVEDAEVQLLWSRAISPYWDVQTGIRYDIEPDGLTHAALGFRGLAPYWFEVDAAAFLSEKGDLTARVEAEYEMVLTQRLILQPRVELEASAADIPERATGSGLSKIDAGLRLRYEFKRELAPYVGVEWQRSLGNTADMVEAAGGDPDKTALMVGIRAWY